MRILIGSIAFLDEGQEAGITSPDYVVFKSRPGIIHPRWLYYWLRSDLGAAFIRTLARGAVRERMLFRRLAAAEIFLPPYKAQLEFANQVLPVERASAAAKTQLKAAKALPAAYLRAVFNSPEAQRWPRKRLREICTGDGQYGTSEKANGAGEGLPVLRMGNLREGRIRWDELKFIQLPKPEEEKYRLVKGDILFNRTNSAELVGKTAVFDGFQDAVFASYLIRFRVIENMADPEFVSAYINSEVGRKFVADNMARAIGQVNISASTMHKMPVPSPSLREQQEISAILSEQMATAERARKTLEAQLTTINKLPAALLRRAFSGEL